MGDRLDALRDRLNQYPVTSEDGREIVACLLELCEVVSDQQRQISDIKGAVKYAHQRIDAAGGSPHA